MSPSAGHFDSEENHSFEQILRLLDIQQVNEQQEEVVDERFIPPVAQPGQVVEILGDVVEGFIFAVHPVPH